MPEQESLAIVLETRFDGTTLRSSRDRTICCHSQHYHDGSRGQTNMPGRKLPSPAGRCVQSSNTTSESQHRGLPFVSCCSHEHACLRPPWGCGSLCARNCYEALEAWGQQTSLPLLAVECCLRCCSTADLQLLHTCWSNWRMLSSNSIQSHLLEPEVISSRGLHTAHAWLIVQAEPSVCCFSG